MSDDSDNKHDPVLTGLAVIGWILPLAGFVWGTGPWWAYVLWLLAGTIVILGYASKTT